MQREIAAVLAVAGLLAGAPALAADPKEPKDTFTQGKQGEAKEALERSAGMKLDDAKIPAPSPPAPSTPEKKKP